MRFRVLTTRRHLAALVCALLIATPALALPASSGASDAAAKLLGSVTGMLQVLLGGGETDDARPAGDRTDTVSGPAGPAIDPDGNDQTHRRGPKPPKQLE